MRVALFITCLTDTFHPRAGIALVKVLEHLGHEVVFPAGQTCCGQPMFNNGFERQARDLASGMIRVFRGHETIVTPSGSCAAMIREHFPGLFERGSEERREAEDLAARTWEFVEFLDEVLKVDLRDLGVRGSGTATYHESCHSRGRLAPETVPRLAGEIDGLALAPLEGVEHCCGFGGVFATKYPAISGGMVREKVARIRETGADTVICNDAGCAMNIAGACRRAGVTADVRSLAEIIAEGLGLLDRNHAP